MDLFEYQAKAMRTSRKDISKTDHLINGALGLTGEAGEVADLVKKHLAQGHALDTEHIVKELGDVLWYVAETATAVGIDMETIAYQNIEKLKKRYPDGFDADKSINRKKGDI